MKVLPSSWPWPSCKQPKTISFRADDNMFKTVNSAYIEAGDVVTTPESWFTNSSESASFSTVSEESGGECLENVIRGLRSERLFFEPGESNSILEEAKGGGGIPFKESVVLAMESKDPYVDFRTSMEEMVEAHGLKDWECLEELLGWYLRVNGKKTHGFIVGAFVDLLVGLAAAAADADASSSSSSSAPCFPPSSPSLSSLRVEGDIEEEDNPSSSEI
ncbi:transcription repressor OFP13-like [Macadamia integrifolia]|uniref:transcription repressor OFP13-like n=1 Tax=Macadamia integrifolia TaxID=60698 RepID=UPI001C533B98|nr:transcription repressor OFP13-like [Macadamia integrifolia]